MPVLLIVARHRRSLAPFTASVPASIFGDRQFVPGQSLFERETLRRG